MKTLKYAVRFLMRAKAYTVINLLGLSFSLACCLMLARYIHRELTVDSHVIEPETMVAVMRDINSNVFLSDNPSPEGPIKGLPSEQIVETCTTVLIDNGLVKQDNKNYWAHVVPADTLFFHFFDYAMQSGERSLADPTKVLISGPFATRLFGQQDPVGKKLSVEGVEVTVGGVFQVPECKTLLNIDVLVPFLAKRGNHAWGRVETQLLRVQPGTDLDAQNAISNVFQDWGTNGSTRYKYIHWRDIYLHASIDSQTYGTMCTFGDLRNLYILGGVLVLLLLVGILNFENLYMVYMQKRTRTYGIKKVFGLHKGTLFFEIWIENFLLVMGALIIASVLLVMVYQFDLAEWMHMGSFTAFDGWILLGILVCLPLLTSLYPYIRYNYRSPISSMRQLDTNRSSIATRVAFLFLQYGISIFLIVVSLYFVQHFRMLTHTSPGYEVENRLSADIIMDNQMSYSKEMRNKAVHIKEQLNACPLIDSYCIEGRSITQLQDLNLTNLVNDKDKKVQMSLIFLPTKFFKLYDIEVVEGELPSEDEYLSNSSMVLNESAMKAMGYKHLEEAFVRGEQPLWFSVVGGKVEEKGTTLMPVKAVVKDFYPGRLTDGIPPMAFMLNRDGIMGMLQMHIKPGKEKEIIPFLRKLKQDFYGADDVEYSWLSEELDQLYESDRQVMLIYSSFAGVAIVISCMGLFGLSLFDIRRRYKEIGIRKVNGAKVKDIWQLLFRKYVVVMLAAFAVASPLAVYFVSSYTEGFAVKAPLGIGIFVLALLLVALISMGTMFWQVNRAAKINPAEVIKNE